MDFQGNLERIIEGILQKIRCRESSWKHLQHRHKQNLKQCILYTYRKKFTSIF